MSTYKEIWDRGVELAYLSNQAHEAMTHASQLTDQVGNVAQSRATTFMPRFSHDLVSVVPEQYAEAKRLSADAEASATRTFNFLLDRVGELMSPENYDERYSNPYRNKEPLAEAA